MAISVGLKMFVAFILPCVWFSTSVLYTVLITYLHNYIFVPKKLLLFGFVKTLQLKTHTAVFRSS